MPGFFIFTHRRSVAKRGGCFWRRLFVCLLVCLFVSQHDNFQTIKRRMMKLGGYVLCTQISPNFECQGQRSRSPGTKKIRKTAESSSLTMHSEACAVGGTQQAATDNTIAWLPGGDGLSRCKISTCCLVFSNDSVRHTELAVHSLS